MEIGCAWMRCVRAGAYSALLMKPSTLYSPSTTTTFSLGYHNNRSLVTLFPIFHPNRPSLSTASCSPPIPLISTDDYAGGDSDRTVIPEKGSKMLLKGMRYAELEQWVKSHGFRPGQALMLWKRMYGNNIWAHCIDELEGLNKDFKKMLGEHAEFKAISLKDILTASDGTRKDFRSYLN